MEFQDKLLKILSPKNYTSIIKSTLAQINIEKARVIKYKHKVATGNPKRPFLYFYDNDSYSKYIQATRSVQKTKNDIKNQTPHTPKPVSSQTTPDGVGQSEDVQNRVTKFELQQESILPSTKKGISSEPNVFGITERTERKYVNQNFQPKFQPAREILNISDLVTEVKSALLKEGMEKRASEWIDATYNTKSTMSNVLNLAYKYVIISSDIANKIRKQIILSSVQDTKSNLIDPNARKQTLEREGQDPNTDIPRPNPVEAKEVEKPAVDFSKDPKIEAAKIGRYRDWWDIYESLPDGWVVDKTAGSPLANTVFITNGKSVLNGQKRALLKVKVTNTSELSQAMLGNQNAKGKHDINFGRGAGSPLIDPPKLGSGGGDGGDLKPIGHGDHGPIYSIDQFSNLKAGIDFLIKKQNGEIKGALSHPEIKEPIDLIWGEPGTEKSDGYGLSKLVKYHREALDDLQGIIGGMEVIKPYSKNRMNLESKTHKASVRLFWDDKQKNWLLTAFEKKGALRNTTDIPQKNEGMTAPSSSHGLDSPSGGKSQVEVASEKIKSFLKYTANDTSNKPKSISLGKVNESVAKRIKELTGIDTIGFQHKLSKYDVKHILSAHGGKDEELRGQIPIEESDLKLIPQIVNEPDKIEDAGSNHQGVPAIRYIKNIGSNFFVIEEVGKSKESLSVRTIYKRAGRREQMAISPQHSTSETFPPADSTVKDSSDGSQEKNEILKSLLAHFQERKKESIKKKLIHRIVKEAVNRAKKIA